MKYVVNTDELRHFATRIENGSLEHRDDRRECARAITAACKAIESFAQTLGEPVAVPDGWKLVPVEPAPEQLKACDTIIQGYGAKLVYMRMVDAAPHHPTTEKGCEVDT